MYLTLYDGYIGTGDTLKDAYEDLINKYEDDKLFIEEIDFYEAKKIKVEMKIIQKKESVFTAEDTMDKMSTNLW